MSIADKITRLSNAKTSIITHIKNKGGTCEDTAGYEDISAAIDTIPTGGGHPVYPGPYEVTPAASQITLDTDNKTTTQDIVVKQVPYAAVDNPAGGQTVTIL